MLDPEIELLRGRRSGHVGQVALAFEGPVESSSWFRKWNGVVAEASKYRPSIDPMQPSVQNGSSINAIGVP